MIITSTIKTAAASFCLALAAGNALAADIIWTGAAGDNRFNTPANWNLGRAPHIGDNAYINAPSSTTIIADSGACSYLFCTSSLVVSAGGTFAVWGGGHVFGDFLMTGSRLDVIGGTLRLYSGFNVWQSGRIWTLSTGPGRGAIEVMPGASMQIGGGGTLTMGADFINSGRVDLTSGEIKIDPTSIDNYRLPAMSIANYGVWRNATGTRVYQSLSSPGIESYVINHGSWMCNGSPGSCGISQFTILSNLGTIEVGRGVSLNIDRTTSIDASTGALWSGTWTMNGGMIHTDGLDITSIGTDASVTLNGSGSAMDGLSRVNAISGSLMVDTDAELTLSPYFLGTMRNDGLLTVGAGAHVRVNGSYLQGPDGILRRLIDNTGQTAIAGVLDTLLSSTVNGDLSIEFYSDNLASGQEFSLIEMAPLACCGISGDFDHVEISGAGDHRVTLRYDQNSVKAVVDSCPVDFNEDGFLDFFDYDAFTVCFEGGECPNGKSADFNGDGFLDFFDYDSYVLAFESGC